MIPIAGPLGALAVASIYYTYRDYVDRLRLKEKNLRERVAYLLWIVAGNVTD